jgi:hypothetical protein
MGNNVNYAELKKLARRADRVPAFSNMQKCG